VGGKNVDQIDISVVIPCYEEEENAAAIAHAVIGELEKAAVSFEIIFIDNASTDRTVEILKTICSTDPRVKLIVNNQNYGQMRSPTHAIYQTSGLAVIGICADFQDPPEMIGEFIARWHSGIPIVLGVRDSEKTSLILRLTREIGYAFYARFGDYRVIPNATGFGLYDKKVVDCLKKWRDPEPFFRGMLVESGYEICLIPYHRPQRTRGKSKNTVAELLNFGLSGLTGSSKKLLRAPLILSVFVFLALAIASVTTLIMCFLGADLNALLLCDALLFMLGVNLFFLGLIGDQVRMIAQIVRNTPLVVESERINFDNVDTAKL
jgi:glycosyltransferase involved in cell wall biosynthesis